MEELEGKLAKFKGAGTKLVTEKELNQATKNLTNQQEEWKKRKKGYSNVVRTFAE